MNDDDDTFVRFRGAQRTVEDLHSISRTVQLQWSVQRCSFTLIPISSFSTVGKQDGFYASRWCNAFYRCSAGIATSFLCPKMPNGARLWWVQHGSPQGVPQETAACTWPCETGRRCASSGGIIVDSGSTIGESQQEAETIFSQSLCNKGGTSDASGAGSGNTDGEFFVSESDEAMDRSILLPAFTVESSMSCLGKADGVFSASGYCNVFHRCVSGSRRDFRCPRATNTPYDLWWNQQTQQCDWPCQFHLDRRSHPLRSFRSHSVYRFCLRVIGVR